MLTEKIIVYLIWSLEHKSWWRENRKGYTENRSEAGQYEFDEAIDIVLEANIQENNIPNEAIVPIEVCAECLGTGVVATMENVYQDEPHQALIGEKPCLCQLKIEGE